MQGAQNRRKSHCRQQLLSEQEEKSIVQWCEHMDDW